MENSSLSPGEQCNFMWSTVFFFPPLHKNNFNVPCFTSQNMKKIWVCVSLKKAQDVATVFPQVFRAFKNLSKDTGGEMDGTSWVFSYKQADPKNSQRFHSLNIKVKPLNAKRQGLLL